MSTKADLRGDGWVEHQGLRGWESFTVSTRVVNVDGEPRLVGLHLTPHVDAPLSSLFLTSSRLRKLPLLELITENLRVSSLDLFGWAKVARKTAAKAGRPRGGGVEHAQAVADVYRTARAAKQPPRQAVSSAFKVSLQTADRYISEARRQGQLEKWKSKRSH